MPQQCEAPGCTREDILARQLCKTHYHRLRDTGSLELKPAVQAPVCSVDGCETFTNSKGYCRLHYERWKRNGHTDYVGPQRKEVPPCSLEDCEKPAHADSLCQMHYRRMMRHGSTDIPKRVQKPGPKPRDREPRPPRQLATAEACANGHLWEEGSFYTYGNRRVCRLCQRVAQQKYFNRKQTPDAPMGVPNGKKTHCPKGHEYTPDNTQRHGTTRACKTCIRERWREQQYGLSAAEFDSMMTDQNESCAICGFEFEAVRQIHVDHDHDSGDVRGLLCSPCNTGLGHFKDSTALLEKAALYLTRG